MKYQTLNRNALFLRAYRSKLSFPSPLVITYVVRRKSGGLRIGITASKKVGGAVERNRARRVIRAAAQQVLRTADGPFDIVFVCRAATPLHKSTEIESMMRKHLQKAGVLS